MNSNKHFKRVKELMKLNKLDFWSALQLYVTTELATQTVPEKKAIKDTLENDYIFGDLEL